MSLNPDRHHRYVVAHPGAELYGSDRVMLESVAGMRSTGAAVTVVLPERGPLVAALQSLGASVEILPTLVLRKSLLKPRGWPTLLASTVRGWRAARRVVKAARPDALYVSTVTLPLWPLVARVSGIPSLVHLHEGEQNASRPIKLGMYAPVRLADDVVVNSEFSRGVLRAAYPRVADRAVVVYNGVAGPDRATPARAELTSPVRVVYVGRLSPRKGPDAAVDAVARIAADPAAGVPEVQLDLVGGVFPGYEWFEADLAERAARPDVAGRVRLLGFHDDVWQLIDGGDVLVVPSRLDEPFGNTAVEGVLAERVVLVSDTSGLREATAGVSTAIRFAPDDADAITAAVREAIARWSDLQPRLADEAAAARERFSPERYRAEIAERMSALTRRGSRGRRRSSRGTT